jgi:putative membrane protein
MKNKMTLITRCTASAVGVALVCLAGTATAQNPSIHPAGKAKLKEEEKAEGSTSPASAAKKPALSAKDKRFVNEAAKGGMMEVEWGKLAAQNGQHADVKKFGNRMVADHSKANDELKALAQKDGLQLPAAPSAGKWKNDKDYVDMMVKDHEKDLSEFQAEAKDGTDADLKKFADKTSKVVEKHLSMIKDIQGKLK